jgi:hypothetical protein
MTLKSFGYFRPRSEGMKSERSGDSCADCRAFNFLCGFTVLIFTALKTHLQDGEEEPPFAVVLVITTPTPNPKVHRPGTPKTPLMSVSFKLSTHHLPLYYIISMLISASYRCPSIAFSRTSHWIRRWLPTDP